MFPPELKKSEVVSLYKKGNAYLPQRYRPISILPAVSKIFETEIKNRLMDYLEGSRLLSPDQHGYRRARSTTTALVSLVERVADAFDDGEDAVVAFSDLSRAFDTVDHRLLLNKLAEYGIRGRTHELFRSYLEGRMQWVQWKGQRSVPKKIRTGVPQGSVLGPVLFLLYVNDLPSNISSGLTCMFADDASFVSAASTLDLLDVKAMQCIDEAKNWFTTIHMKMNQEKTQILKLSVKIGQQITVRTKQ